MNESERSASTSPGSDHPEDAAVFRQARLRLTAWYALTLALIVLGFSVALYLALAAELPSHNGEGSDLQPAQQAERDTSDFTLRRLRLLLFAGNVVLLAGGVASAYVLSGKTLRPIAAALSRQRRFAGDASHELRTPLTVMRGTIDVTLKRERTPAVYRDTLREVGDEVDVMTTLVDQLLSLARGQRTQALPTECDLRAILEQVVREASTLATERSSSAILIPGPALPLIADGLALRQVFANLVRNALQHTPDGTHVTIAAGPRAGGIEVLVRDDGPGIPRAERERIFAPFYRVQTTGADGTGLGLALARELVAAHGGTIAAEESPDGGATFRVQLPGAVAQPLRPVEASRPSDAG